MGYDCHKKCPMCAEEIPFACGEYPWSIHAHNAAGIMISNSPGLHLFVVARQKLSFVIFKEQ
jgi:hypothetical protein